MHTIQHPEIVSFVLSLLFNANSTFRCRRVLGSSVWLVYGCQMVLSEAVDSRKWMPNNRKGTKDMEKAIVKGLKGVDQWP